MAQLSDPLLETILQRLEWRDKVRPYCPPAMPIVCLLSLACIGTLDL